MKNELNFKVILIGILLLSIDIFIIGHHTYYWFIEDRISWRSTGPFDGKFSGYLTYLSFLIVSIMILSYGLGLKNKLSYYGEKLYKIFNNKKEQTK